MTGFEQKQIPKTGQVQWLMMLPRMQQAIQVLQMPVTELAPLVEAHFEQNPLMDTELADEGDEESQDDSQETKEPLEEQPLEFNEEDFRGIESLFDDFPDHLSEWEFPVISKEYQTFAEQSICSEATLSEHLLTQAREFLPDPKEFSIAEILIGNLDQNGYLHVPFSELVFIHGHTEEAFGKVLKVIQTFEPYGVGASSLQEALLIQLKCLGKGESLAAKIVEFHFDDLIHNRIPRIHRLMGCSEEQIVHVIAQDLSHLEMHPGISFSRQVVQTIIPDACINSEGEELQIVINEEFIPLFRLNPRYRAMLEDEGISKDTKTYIRHQFMSTKWLIQNISQRNETLKGILGILMKKQRPFFSEPKGELIPLTMQLVANELGLHESTVARAVSNKYVNCPRGVLPLRYFFNSALSPKIQSVSSKTVQDTIQGIIQKEDKHKPYSDAVLVKLLHQQGIQCARRTIAKYRTALQIGNAHQRKKHTSG